MATKKPAEPRAWPANTPAILTDVGKLKPHPKNSRKHPEEQVEHLARLIDRFGFTNPVLADEGGTIIAGEGRWLAAKKRGRKAIPVITAVGWTESEKRAYIIADNKVSEESKWDPEQLNDELAALVDEFDRDILGFDQAETEAIAVREVETGEVRDEFWISVRGPLKSQAKILKALEQSAEGEEDVQVELGTIKDR